MTTDRTSVNTVLAPHMHRRTADENTPADAACGARCVNVNKTDATTGVTALLLPAQKTHTLHDSM